ncbi:MAG: type II toxin-antitoxin system RelE/ParE family toxin [bacterium]
MGDITYSYNFARYFDKVPMIEFIDSLAESEQAKLYAYIHKFIEMKNSNIRLSDKFTKYLKNGIFELKVNFENRVSRSLYFYEDNKQIIFTNGFIKKTNKTPINEINRAFEIRKYYKENQ